MKKRYGYVSNSSSSSFCIFKRHLTASEIEKIENHPAKHGDHWYIQEEEGKLLGEVSMDNFNMGEYLEEIGIPDEIVHWGYDSWDFNGLEDDMSIHRAKPCKWNFCPNCGYDLKGENNEEA